MASKLIGEVRWAEVVPRPSFIPKGRPRGSKAAGLAFERLAIRSIAGCAAGLWFRYADQRGVAYCAPDGVLQVPWGTIVVEVKYTDTPQAYSQVDGYRRVVRSITGGKVGSIVLCKRLTPHRHGLVVDNLRQAITAAFATNTIPTLHWLGHDAGALLLPWPAVPLPKGLALASAAA